MRQFTDLSVSATAVRHPWWWLLASQGMDTSVWSRDTGDTSKMRRLTYFIQNNTIKDATR